MADYTRNLPADVFDCTTVDNNAKSEAGAGPPMVQLAPEGDVFGDAQDGNWVEVDGNTDIHTGWPGKGGASVAEGSGVLQWTDAAGTAWLFGWKRTISYKDCDLVFVYDPTDALQANGTHVAYLRTLIWAGPAAEGNFVEIIYRARVIGGAPDHTVMLQKRINRANTVLATSVDLNAQSHMEFRVKRVAATNTFTVYYRTSGDPTAWTQLWTGVITDATYFPTNCDVYAMKLAHQITANNSFDPAGDSYAQKIDDGIAAQRFWPDSPEAGIKDSANCGGGESYAFDAAVNKTWALTGASSVEDGDGGSNKWKVGFSDAADGSGVTWDGTWQTIAQVNTNAGNGNYDGHRYLYVKWQGNGTSAQQPNATSFTISGAAVGAGIASSIFESSIFKSGVFR